MKLMLFVLMCLIPVTVPAADWQPPQNPNPQEILQSIRSDVQAKDYQTALAKHVWFHENALKHNSALTGVRLSFALAYWDQLAQIYPPALEKLKEIRDQTTKQVLDGKDVATSFQELEALNRTLDQNNMTVDTFLLLHKEHPEKAKLAYRLAQPALLKAKEYKICGEYLEPEKSYQLLVRTREANQQLAKNPQIGPGILEFSDKHFSNQTAILVALLVVNDRREEARSIAEKARKEWDNADFHKALDSALTGTVPPSWPY